RSITFRDRCRSIAITLARGESARAHRTMCRAASAVRSMGGARPSGMKLAEAGIRKKFLITLVSSFRWFGVSPSTPVLVPDPLRGTPYRAVRQLGAGAMGLVLEAEHRKLRRI